MSHIFVSYSRKDIDYAGKIVQALAENKLDTWIDWEGIPPTVDWWQEIEKGIEEADIFLFFLSPDSVKSKVCNQEIAHAVKNGKRLIPIVVRDITSDEVPPEISHLNWMFFRKTDEFDLAFAKLMTAIKTDYGWVQVHRQLQVKALEWERSNHENSFLLRGKELQDAELQLARNTSKEPHPTNLQREYVFKSRQASDKQRRITFGIAIAGVIALAALAVYGFVQAGLATTNAKTAQNQAETAQAVSTLAVENAATAQAASTLAFNNAATAQANASVALARQLAAQAITLADNQIDLALLLSVEANHLATNLDPVYRPETKDSLLRALAVAPNLEIILRGHTDYVQSVAFSPDGKMLASGSFDRMVRLWDVSTGQLAVEPLVGHTDWVRSVAFNPDGTILASGSQDGTLRLWDTKTGQPMSEPLKGYADKVTSVAFSPDGKELASGASNGTVELWDINGQPITSTLLSGHTGWIQYLIFSADGKKLYSNSPGDATIIFWDLEQKSMIGTPLNLYADSIALSPDNQTLAYGDTAGTIKFLSVESQQPVGPSFRGTQGGSVDALAYSPDGSILASGSIEKLIQFWDPQTGIKIAPPLTGHKYRVTSLAFSPDGKTLASASEDHTVRVWSSDTDVKLARMNSRVWSMAISPDHQVLAAGSENGQIWLWNTITGQMLEDPLIGHTTWVMDVAFSPDSKMLASAGCTKSEGYNCQQNEIRLWQVATGKPLGTLTGLGVDLTRIAFSPDGKTLAASSNDNAVWLWELQTQQQIDPPIPGHERGLTGVVFSPDGRTLAMGGDHTVQLWDVTSRNRIGLPLDHGESLFTMAFSDDGKMLATGGGDKTGGDKTIRLWNVAAQKQIGVTLVGHHGSITNLMFSPDGSTLVSGSVDGTVRLWDTITARPLGPPIPKTGRVVAFSQDGQTILASDGSFFFDWDIDLGVLEKRACRIVNRNLTRDEYAIYINPDPGAYDTYYDKNPTCSDLPLELVSTPQP